MLVLRQAQAAFNLTTDFGNAGELEKAEHYYGQIVALLAKFATPDIALEQAKAATYLALCFCEKSRK